jgi:transcriptional regulator with XRE-family HTH domain
MSILRELREKQGLTQVKLAELANTTQPMIGRLENGQRVMTVKWARILAPILKTTPEDLLFRQTAETEEARQKHLADVLKRLIEEHGFTEVSQMIAALRAVTEGQEKAGNKP